MRFAEKLCQNFWDFEDSAVVLSGYAFSEFGERCGIEHALYAFHHIPETFQYNADALFLHPLGVVTLLRKRPGVAFDQCAPASRNLAAVRTALIQHCELITINAGHGRGIGLRFDYSLRLARTPLVDIS